ncbi:MAG TPA: hypothetical protein VLN73_00280, partial [Alphaproteobacteria bacterium]|nr:hypothetical protein [Alphaproteobacteria bacterium]
QANAFVDGELDHEGRSEVLSRAATEPTAAQELADLSRLKSALHASIEAPRMVLPPAAGKRISRGQRRFAMALAAALALAFVAGAAWWWAPAQEPDHGLPVAWALRTHKSWRAADPGSAAAPLRPANLALNAHVPDLAAAKLTIAHIGDAEAPGGGPALVVGYRGTRGCRVTLIVDTAPNDLGLAPIFFQSDGVQAMVWRAGPLRHQILAQGMDKARFRMIATTVRRGTIERLPLDEPTRVALAKSRAASPPCAA